MVLRYGGQVGDILDLSVSARASGMAFPRGMMCLAGFRIIAFRFRPPFHFSLVVPGGCRALGGCGWGYEERDFPMVWTDRSNFETVFSGAALYHDFPFFFVQGQVEIYSVVGKT